MTNAVLDAPAEATDAPAVEASLDETKGTTAEDVTVQAGDTEKETTESEGSAHSADGEDASELKHSDASLAAERETASQDGYQRAVKEISDLRSQRDTRLLELVKADKADDVAVVRAVRNQLLETANLDGQEAEPILGLVKQAMSVHLEAAGVLVAEKYSAEINLLFDTPAERKAFWEEAAGLDPTLQVGEVMRLAIEKKSLSTKAIKDADPETLLKTNSKLKAYVEHERDAARRAGRVQGKKDPPGDRSGSGAGSVPATATYEQLSKMKPADMAAFKAANPEAYAAALPAGN